MQTCHTLHTRSAGFAGQLDIVSEELSHTSLPLSLIEMLVKRGHEAAMRSGSSVRVAILLCSLMEQLNDGFPAKQLGIDDELLCLLPIRAHLGIGDARVGSRVSPSLTSMKTWPHRSLVVQGCSCHLPVCHLPQYSLRRPPHAACSPASPPRLCPQRQCQLLGLDFGWEEFNLEWMMYSCRFDGDKLRSSGAKVDLRGCEPAVAATHHWPSYLAEWCTSSLRKEEEGRRGGDKILILPQHNEKQVTICNQLNTVL